MLFSCFWLVLPLTKFILRFLMRLKNLIPLYFVLVLVLSSSIALLAFLLLKTMNDVVKAETSRFESITLAGELRKSSDDLTKFARLYVLTRDTIYRKYFQNILDIRNGVKAKPDNFSSVYWDLLLSGEKEVTNNEAKGISLQERMKQLGFDEAEFELLSLAQRNSDRLAILERGAFEIVDRINTDKHLSDRQTHELHDSATRLVHDQRYHSAKSAIMEPIGKFEQLVNHRTTAKLNEMQKTSGLRLTVLIGGTILLMIALILLFQFFRIKVIKKTKALAETAEKISAGNLDARSDIKGSDELGVLGIAFDNMVSDLGKYIELQAISKDEIEKERTKSDSLLLNILPADIAEELKSVGNVGARGHHAVSILFTDFKEFTKIAESMPPDKLVSELDACFKAFDQICEKHGVEKIKTIGDAYMAAGGLGETKFDSVKNTILVGLEMIRFLDERRKERASSKDITFEMRAGIHTGPVIAGVVGSKKFQYDFWGNTVNTASRLETNSEPGKLNISRSTYEFIKLDKNFDFEYRGKIEAKGKGAIEMYFVSLATKNTV